jgi:UDP-N-acetylmuramate--alanine ligase
MAALGAVLLDRGYLVSGSDLKSPAAVPALAALAARGARLTAGHAAANLPPDAKLAVYSLAVPEHNPERAAALARGLATASYAAALAALVAERRGVLIAGTHGKSTTTSLVALAMRQAGRDPSFVVGADVPQLGTTGHGGSGEHFVVEACEYRRSFLEFEGEIGAIVNVEAEHLDCFSDFPGVKAAFSEFAAKLPEHGLLVIGPAAAPHVTRGAARRIVAGDDPRADVRPRGLRYERGCGRFSLEGAFTTPEIALQVPGAHLVADSVIAAAVLHGVGLDGDAIATALSSFTGAGRRLEVFGRGRLLAISDYAHHPTEIDAVRSALRAAHPGRRLVAVFQPHQAARLLAFAGEFAASLADFDLVLVMPVYAVRDTPQDVAAADAPALARDIESRGGRALATAGGAATIEALRVEARDADVVVLLGAGDIDDLRDDVRSALSLAP